jgi:DNA repair exonuclease SbcCD ATPase subunit
MSTNIEQRVAKLEEFAADVRAYTQILTEMIRRHDERLDEVRAEAANADVRIAALADAQIQTEDALRQLTARMGDTDERLNKLLGVVERHTADGHGGQG